MTSPPQDPREGEALREAALTSVEANANKDWMGEAYRVGVFLAQNTAQFTTDHIWERMAPGFSTHDPRAMGAVMRSLSSGGHIERTDRTVNSHRPECHRRPVRLWRSLIRSTA